MAQPSPIPDSPFGRHASGIMPSHVLERLIADGREVIPAEPLVPGQLQPASLDLRLGAKAWRVRASFLPGQWNIYIC
jgi:dCTP deaminase